MSQKSLGSVVTVEDEWTQCAQLLQGKFCSSAHFPITNRQ